MADTTTKGFPYPEGPDPVDVAGDIQALAEAIDDMPGVQSYTGSEIAALAVGEKWAGRVVWNSTTGKLQVSNGSTFSDVDTSLALSSTTPAALGVAAVGNGTTAARDNHVHAMPSASDVGAISNALIADKGKIAAGNGSSVVALSPGANETRLVADSGQAAGLKYVADTTNYAVGAKGDLLVGTAADTLTNVAVGTNGHILRAASGQTSGVEWVQPALTLITTTTFTTASTVVEDGVFTSAHSKYLLLFDFTAASATDAALRFYFRQSGSDTLTSYVAERIAQWSTTITGSEHSAGDFGVISTTYPTFSQYQVVLHSPQLARRTVWTSDGFYVTNAGTPNQIRTAGYQDSATAFDGIKIYPAGGTLSGTVRIYGYGN